MAYNITIAGTDRTADVIAQSITVEDVLNDVANTCYFRLADLSDTGIPATDDEVIITLADDTKLFAGTIVTVSFSSVLDTGKVIYQITCVDYTRLFDSRLVHKAYESQTDKEIIEDIVSTYCQDLNITTVNVVEGVTINAITFNYIQPSQALRRLCELTGRSWYIDYDKDIHYFPTETTSAPFNITSASAAYSNLRLNKNASQVKNRVYVRGGTYLSDFTTFTTTGDGEMRSFVLPDKPHSVTVEVNDVAKTVGIKNVHTSGYDWYLNFQEKYIEQDSAGTVLETTDKLEVIYKYDIPVLVAVEDTASIAENGVKEFAIFDTTLTTQQAARDRASAELTDYANDLVDGSFETITNGFQAGEYLTITLTDYDVDDNYLIQSVVARSLGGEL